MEDGSQAPGLIASARAFGGTLLDIVGTRAELALIELREEGERKKAIAVLLAVAAIFLALGLLLASFFVVAFFWETHRLTAIAAMSVLHIGIAAAAYAHAAARLRAGPPAFEATLRELAADREAMRESHE